MSHMFSSPFHQGQVIVIPAGTTVTSRNPQRNGASVVSESDERVTVFGICNGTVDSTGSVVLPTITWTGADGYFQDTQVTDALLAGNDFPPLAMGVQN
jgi:hypothetical protein